jgi:hypothetical protein
MVDTIRRSPAFKPPSKKPSTAFQPHAEQLETLMTLNFQLLDSISVKAAWVITYSAPTAGQRQLGAEDCREKVEGNGEQ